MVGSTCMVAGFNLTSCMPSQKEPNTIHGVLSPSVMKAGSMALKGSLPSREHMRGPSSVHWVVVDNSGDESRPMAEVFTPKVEHE